MDAMVMGSNNHGYLVKLQYWDDAGEGHTVNRWHAVRWNGETLGLYDCRSDAWAALGGAEGAP